MSPLASVQQPGPPGRAVFRGILRPVPGYAYCSTDDVQGVVIHEFQACCPRSVGGGVRHGGRRRRLSGCAPERGWNNCRSYAESERDRHAGGPARDRNGSARNPRRCHKACFGRSAGSRACSRTEHKAGARPPGSSPNARASSAGRECSSPTGGPGKAERQREGTGFRFSDTGRRPGPGYVGSAHCPGERPSSSGGRTDDRGSASAP